jgi:hypothetical protein
MNLLHKLLDIIEAIIVGFFKLVMILLILGTILILFGGI